MRIRPSSGLALAVLVLLLAGGGTLLFRTSMAERPRHPTPASNDPIARGCGLDPVILERIERGHYPGRSEDITFVPYEPNYLGSFSVTSHSGPWDYVQQVPLVLYGPQRVKSLGLVEDDATLADVYPTASAWTDVDLPPRPGRVLKRAVKRQERPPKLLVFVMWDGVGRNVLRRWPHAWPTLKRLERDGTSYLNATVGSSPSITPATHANLGTGAFPNEHGLTAIKYRGSSGRIETAFQGRDPRDLELSTFADEIDLAFDNESKVGLVAPRVWHMPILGHGAAAPGGDKDQLALIGGGGQISGNPRLYDTPAYVRDEPDLQALFDELDERDGVKDGEWRGHPIAESHDNPAWVAFETEILLEMWERGGYGDDAIPDLFFVNYKMTDVVGHQYSLDSREMEEVLQAQDRALADLIGYLDVEVRDYALVVSADHGHTPFAGTSGGWPFSPRELEKDLDAHFDIPEDENLIEMRTAVGLFVDSEVAHAAGVADRDIARFLNAYTIRGNWPEDKLPEGYEGRGDEVIFEAAFPSEDLREILSCSAPG